MKRIAGFLLMLLSICFTVFIIYRLVDLNRKPEPYEINFTDFGGKILAEEEITPPEKFSQQIPFAEAICWGKEATLTLGYRKGTFPFRIWRPDPLNSGEFQYEEKIYEKAGPWDNILWKISMIENQGNKFIFIPERDKKCIFILLAVFSTIFFLFLQSSWGLLRRKN